MSGFFLLLMRIQSPDGLMTHNAHFVCKFLAFRPGILAHEGTFRVYEETQRSVFGLGFAAERSEGYS